jgi:leader peptidase (prepilin peptidase)/N-methyltransferase
MFPEAFILPILAACFGLIFGSFLNVCISRLPYDQPIDAPRSSCPRCATPIAWYDNVPLLSFVILGGRCRHCKAAISFRYPIVEFLTAAAFFYVVSRLGLEWAALKWCLFAAIQIELIFSDLETRILPDEFTKWGAVLGGMFSAVVLLPAGLLTDLSAMVYRGQSREFYSLISSLGAAAVLSGSLWFVGWAFQRLRGKEGLGFGDVKMVGMMGAFLGLETALYGLMIGSLLGSVLGLAWIKLRKERASDFELPFGSFLGVGALIAAGMTLQHPEPQALLQTLQRVFA